MFQSVLKTNFCRFLQKDFERMFVHYSRTDITASNSEIIYKISQGRSYLYHEFVNNWISETC